MARSSQDSSSTRARNNYRFIRRGHNSENRRTPYGTEQSYSPVRRRSHRSGYSLPCISFHFTGTTHIHLPPANGSFVMPTHAARPQDLRTSVGGTGGAGRGSSGAGYHQRTQKAGNIGPAPSLHTDVAGPEYPRGGLHPQQSGGLYNGGFTSGAQMDAVRPGPVTGVQTPADGLGPAGSSGVGYNQLSPISPSGFAGQTLQAPILQEYDTRAAATPPTLDQQLFPPSLATAANNAFAEEFLPPAVSDNFMHMI
ncbi:hypothetical protein QYF36_009114 [Acer negundo]|nr:hypothetical protein QYF36_009114 [Acer negundo]